MIFNLIVILSFSWIFNPISSLAEKSSKCRNSLYIIDKSQRYHDEQNKWSTLSLNLHIQEPRLANPTRYSIIQFNNKEGTFSLERDSEYGTVIRSINSAGVNSITLNWDTSFSKELREELRLIESNNILYKSFYHTFYGLPMSLKEMENVSYSEAESVIFFGEDVYRINIKLDEALISNNWNLYISQEDYSMFALEFVHDEKDNELLKFESSINIDGVRIPRFRHWYNPVKQEYRGSDIIVKEN